jgi:hypothetical protein
MTHDYKYEGESEEDKNSLIPPQYKKLESTNTQSDLTSSTGADKSGCICDDGFGMNLSCPVHHPTSSTQSPDLTQILDEIEEQAGRRQDLSEALVREVTIKLDDNCLSIDPRWAYPILREAFAKLLAARQDAALVKALRRAIGTLKREQLKGTLADITAILNQGRKN